MFKVKVTSILPKVLDVIPKNQMDFVDQAIQWASA